EFGAVGGAEVIDLAPLAIPEDLDVLARDAAVVDGDVGVAAATDDGARLRDRMALAVDVEHRDPGDVALHILGVDRDDAIAGAVVLPQPDADTAGELVVLRGGVPLHEARQLVDQCRAE